MRGRVEVAIACAPTTVLPPPHALDAAPLPAVDAALPSAVAPRDAALLPPAASAPDIKKHIMFKNFEQGEKCRCASFLHYARVRFFLAPVCETSQNSLQSNSFSSLDQ